MVRYMKVCVTQYFNAAHYMPVEGEVLLHGHTFKLIICVSGPIGENSMVFDFIKLKKIVKNVISSFDYSLIIPRKDVNKVGFKGPFKVKLVPVNGHYSSAESILKTLCKELKEKLRNSQIRSVELILYETSDSYVKGRC